MRNIFANTKLIITVAALFSIFSLALSVFKHDVEWFQASGAVVTIGGVVLAARKIIRLGIEGYIRDEQIIDGGHFPPTPEEIEYQKQFEKDINSYKCSIILLVIGTMIWAYGGIFLKLCGINA